MAIDLVRSLAQQVTDAQAGLDAALAARDAAIHTAYTEGWSMNAIADATGLTPARVGMILGHPHGKVGRPARG